MGGITSTAGVRQDHSAEVSDVIDERNAIRTDGELGGRTANQRARASRTVSEPVQFLVSTTSLNSQDDYWQPAASS